MQKQKDEDEFLPDDTVEIIHIPQNNKKKSAPRHVAFRKKKFVRAQGFVSARPPRPYMQAAKLSRI